MIGVMNIITGTFFCKQGLLIRGVDNSAMKKGGCMNHKTQTEQEFQKLAVQIKERMIDNLNLNDDYYLELAKKLIPYGITCHGDFVDFNEEFLISNILNALKRIMPNVQINVELKHFDC